MRPPAQTTDQAPPCETNSFPSPRARKGNQNATDPVTTLHHLRDRAIDLLDRSDLDGARRLIDAALPFWSPRRDRDLAAALVESELDVLLSLLSISVDAGLAQGHLDRAAGEAEVLVAICHRLEEAWEPHRGHVGK